MPPRVLRPAPEGVAVEDAPAVPHRLALQPPYPNPFSASTRFEFDVPEPGPVRLAVFDLLGRAVRVLVDDERPAGRYAIEFEPGELASGLYLCRLQTPAGARTQQIVYLRDAVR